MTPALDKVFTRRTRKPIPLTGLSPAWTRIAFAPALGEARPGIERTLNLSWSGEEPQTVMRISHPVNGPRVPEFRTAVVTRTIEFCTSERSRSPPR